MQITLLAFGIAKDIIGASSLSLDMDPGATVGDLRAQLTQRFPSFARLASLRIAVNTEYVPDTQTLHPRDEVVLIPPVSGG